MRRVARSLGGGEAAGPDRVVAGPRAAASAGAPPARRATTIIRFANLLFAGIYAGFLVSVLFVEAALRGFPPAVYVVVEQVKHTNLNLLAAGSLAGLIATSLLLLALLRPVRSPSFRLTLAGLGCGLAALAITLTVNVPINALQMAWDPQAPPADWAQVRERWQAAHAARTAASLAGFGCQILAALAPQPASWRPAALAPDRA